MSLRATWATGGPVSKNNNNKNINKHLEKWVCTIWTSKSRLSEALWPLYWRKWHYNPLRYLSQKSRHPAWFFSVPQVGHLAHQWVLWPLKHMLFFCSHRADASVGHCHFSQQAPSGEATAAVIWPHSNTLITIFPVPALFVTHVCPALCHLGFVDTVPFALLLLRLAITSALGWAPEGLQRSLLGWFYLLCTSLSNII